MSKRSNLNITKIVMPLIAVLTLGLAPFFPEPHFFGKVKWVLGGANGMNLMDWFDLIFHGAPWIWLLFALVAKLKEKFHTIK